MPTAVQRLVEVVKAEQQQYSFQMFLTPRAITLTFISLPPDKRYQGS